MVNRPEMPGKPPKTLMRWLTPANLLEKLNVSFKRATANSHVLHRTKYEKWPRNVCLFGLKDDRLALSVATLGKPSLPATRLHIAMWQENLH